MRLWCRDCGYTVHGATAKICRNNLSRHIRERHGDGSALTRRRSQQARRKLAVHHGLVGCTVQPSPSCRACAGVLVYVTSPAQRDDMFNATLSELVRIGVPVAAVRRRRGFAFRAARAGNMPVGHCARPTRPPEGLRLNTFLMWDFHKNFIPTALRACEGSNNDVKVVLWVEDDTRFADGIQAQDIIAAVRNAEPSFVWLGYILKAGKPHWGSHLLGFSPASLQIAKKTLDAAQAQSRSRGKPLQYLVGLDTWVRRVLTTTQDGHPVASVVSRSMACQRQHAKRGRAL